MDQLTPILQAMKKHYFWILTGLVLLISSIVFYLSSSTLHGDIDSRVSAINGKFLTVNAVNALAPTHPNDASKTGMEKIIDQQTQDVQKAWELQYERQKNILVWPQATSPVALTQLDKYRPIEQYVTAENPNEGLIVSHREQYRDYINKVFPDLAKIIGANWTAPPLSGSKQKEVVTTRAPLVNWTGASQTSLRTQIVPWYDPQKPPTTLDILYSQEDLWILEGLMNIIAAVNGDARENFQAPIKDIEWIRIGSAANSAAGEITEFAAERTADSANPYASQYPTSSSTSPSSGGGSSYGDPTKAAVRDPANFRYVDSNYKPVSSIDLISKIKSQNPEDAFFAVAKRIPIQMRFKMDQRKVANLIAQCGNNALLVEVKQVRIAADASAEGAGPVVAPGGGGGGANPYGAAYGSSSNSDSSSSETSGSMYGAAYSGGGVNGSSSGGTTGVNPLADKDIQWLSEKPTDLEVEIYGIVLLFNPVDIAKLGIEKVEDNTELTTTVDSPKDNGGESPTVPTPPPTPPAAAAQTDPVAPEAAPATAVPAAPPETPAPASATAPPPNEAASTAASTIPVSS